MPMAQVVLKNLSSLGLPRETRKQIIPGLTILLIELIRPAKHLNTNSWWLWIFKKPLQQHLHKTSSPRRLLQPQLLICYHLLLGGIHLPILVRRGEILREVMEWKEKREAHSASRISDSLQDTSDHRSDTQGEVTEIKWIITITWKKLVLAKSWKNKTGIACIKQL